MYYYFYRLKIDIHEPHNNSQYAAYLNAAVLLCSEAKFKFKKTTVIY